jgi:hypothetical protein
LVEMVREGWEGLAGMVKEGWVMAGWLRGGWVRGGWEARERAERDCNRHTSIRQ